MDDSEVQLQFNSRRRLSPSEGFENLVLILIDKIHEDPTTGYQTLTESKLVNFNLRSSNHRYIHQLLHNRLDNFRWLSDDLAAKISVAATNLGFGPNGFIITIKITITSSLISKAVLMKLVLGGRLDEADLKSLKMETEPCSICLENLSDSNPSVPTRMNCSHVFHDHCLLDWLYRKNTCPLCRTVLYDR